MRNINGRHAYGCVALETLAGSHGGHHLPCSGRKGEREESGVSLVPTHSSADGRYHSCATDPEYAPVPAMLIPEHFAARVNHAAAGDRYVVDTISEDERSGLRGGATLRGFRARQPTDRPVQRSVKGNHRRTCFNDHCAGVAGQLPRPSEVAARRGEDDLRAWRRRVAARSKRLGNRRAVESDTVARCAVVKDGE